MQAELLNKRLPNTQDGILKKYLWDATMVARILRDESYIGTLLSILLMPMLLYSAVSLAVSVILRWMGTVRMLSIENSPFLAAM